MLGVFEGYVGIYFCRGSSFEVVEVLRKGFIVKFVVWGELRQEVVSPTYPSLLSPKRIKKSHIYGLIFSSILFKTFSSRINSQLKSLLFEIPVTKFPFRLFSPSDSRDVGCRRGSYLPDDVGGKPRLHCLPLLQPLGCLPFSVFFVVGGVVVLSSSCYLPLLLRFVLRRRFAGGLRLQGLRVRFYEGTGGLGEA